MADGAADVCICVLFYGAEDKHFKLAQRVLNEPMRCLAKRNIEFRFGCNAVGKETSTFLTQQINQYFHNALLVYSKENMLKYPMMRCMFRPRIAAPITLWLDHDSYLSVDVDANSWLNSVTKHLTGCCDILGSVQKSKLSDEQVAWAKTQPWFNSGVDNTYLSYPTGGWWAIKTELLYRFDWPSAEFKQKNGDLLLGVMAKHQGLSLCHYRGGIAVNANAAGVEAAAPRTIQ